MSEIEDHLSYCCRALLRRNVLGAAPYSDSATHLFRLYLGSEYAATLRQIDTWMTEVGMSTRIDAAGNIVGRYEGTRSEAPVRISHTLMWGGLTERRQLVPSGSDLFS